MKIAIFGGTFNPVHNGHINLLKECCKQYSFDKILLIPTNLPPHKAANKLISNEHRFNMLKLAVAADDGTHDNALSDSSLPEAVIEVSDIEYKLGAKSYTINTINELKKRYNSAEFFLIAGSDMLFSFDKWYQYENILRAVTLVIGARHGAEHDRLLSISKSFGALSEKIKIINITAVDISSTQIRDRLAKNEDISGLVDGRVEKYIKENNLYKSEQSGL